MKPELTDSVSPLAREIYRRLVRHVRGGHASITYGELATLVSERHPIHPRSSKLHAALGEITAACRRRELPILPAIVWRADSRQPSDGYYPVAHPRSRSLKTQIAAWELEHARVLRDQAKFPGAL
ncbi:MAG: hypothetical protein ABI867_27960 [Kofleriaceae bacterium]